jgi:flagellar assembly protein FliH
MPVKDVSRLIKARAIQGDAGGKAFNYDDLQEKCRQLVASARQQARTLLDQARDQAVAIRQAARDEGVAAGRQEGLAEAHDRIEARAAELAGQQAQATLSTALPALAKVVEELDAARDRWLLEWEVAAVRLAVCLAERIVRQELARRPELAANLVREALRLATGHARVVLRLHPEDLALLRQGIMPEVARLVNAGDVQVLPDAAVSRGGCTLESESLHVDGRLETQFERLACELLESAPC